MEDMPIKIHNILF